MLPIHIALKDMKQYSRSAFALVMMFVAPILVTGLIALAFGGVGGGGSFTLPATRVVVANQDTGAPEARFHAGDVLVDTLLAEGVADYLTVTERDSPEEARAALEQRAADVAIIIPENLTAAVTAHDEAATDATIEIVHDPTLILGPAIVKAVVDGYADAVNGVQIAATVVARQLAERGEAIDHDVVEASAAQYVAWVQAQSGVGGSSAGPAIVVQAPPEQAADDMMTTRIIGTIAIGMIIFFAFYTGASTAGSIIREDEEGTLARLFTTPVPRTVVLGGKLLSVGATLVAQLTVLLLLTALIFGIRWGLPAAVLLAALGTTVAASGFGVCVMSFVDNSRQTGPVMGGVLTVAGLLGGLMTTGFQSLPAAYTTVTLLTPHGWALRAWKLALEGAGGGALLLPAVVLLLYGGALFAVGALRFRRRFA